MEHLQDGHYVRLRSRVHLYADKDADKDGHGVSLHHRRDSMNAAWAVHLYQGNANAQAQHMLLHSAAYGRYLVATNTPAPLGHRGRRVEQRNYDDQGEEAIRWVAVGADSGPGNDVLLRNVAGRYLRANGRYIHTGVSVDAFDNFSTKMQWVVEPIPVRAGADGRRLSRGAFVFKGKSIMGVPDLAMCVEVGAFGRPTPLVVDLLRSRQNLHILVFAVGTPAHAGVRYPDVDAV